VPVETEIDWTPKALDVLAAASELFYAHGIHAVGVDAIAARAGVTKKTLYDRFGSKDRLVAEYLAARDRRWRDLLTARLDAAGPDARDGVRAVFTATREWSETEGRRGCAMVNAHAELAESSPARAVVTAEKRWLLDLFEGIARRSGVPGPQDAARVLVLLHEGALVSFGLGTFDDVFTRAEEAALAVLGR
jgi:AcrR family transcriptional regulator